MSVLCDYAVSKLFQCFTVRDVSDKMIAFCFVDHEDASAFLTEFLRNTLADAVCASCDNSDFSVKFIHICTSCSGSLLKLYHEYICCVNHNFNYMLYIFNSQVRIA